ncbi:MAG: lamin tail domain-containing protein [Polyangiaceae bacterium]|nr:lamin tail domain-containing protein [Polyangiaceae bacterium]
MRTAHLLFLTASLALVACGGDETTGTSTSTGSSTGSGAGGEGGAGGAGGSAGGAGPGSEKIVINEMNARSPLLTDLEWLEIVNSGDTAFSLNGYAITDTNPMVGGTPNLKGALRFPAEAVIPANGYFIILCDQAMEAKPVAHPDCLMGAPPGTVCYHVTWKISASTGERVYFLAPNDSTISTADYPDPLQVSPVDGETWARLPNITGEFGVGTPTPGSANMPAAP